MSSDKKLIIGFVGLGTMGGAIALNFQKAGYDLVVHDIRKEMAAPFLLAGAKWADTPKELASHCDVLFTSVPGPDEIKQVALGVNGLIEGVREGAVYFELSTNTVEFAQELNTIFSKKGAYMCDAAISGGAGGAKRGRLAVWVGGDKDIFDRYLPVLRTLGDRPLYVGPSGAGRVVQLVAIGANQSMQAALAENFVIGVKAGADPLALWEAIRQGSVGRRRTFDGLIDEFLPAIYDEKVNTFLKLIHMDMQILTELGRVYEVPMRFANLAYADLVEAMNRGWADRDSRAVMLLPQERSGVSIKVSTDAIQEVLRRDPAAPSDTKHGSGL